MGGEMIRLDPASHVYTDGGRVVPGVTDVIKSNGLIDDAWFTEYARDRGQAVHAAAALDDDGLLDESTLDPAIVGYVEAWRRFKRESGFQSKWVEKVLFHPVYRYAGTVDRIGSMSGADWVIDFKTGEVLPWVALQTAAYAIAYGKPCRRAGVKLNNDGTYRLKEFADKNDGATFLAALTMHNFKKGNSRT